MEITASMVKELRAATGAGVMDCRKALEQTQGDMAKATELLRDKALAAAAKKASREAREGIIGHYVHTGSRMASLVEVNCETDFVARTEEFQRLARELAMQVVAARPEYLRPEDVPAAVVEEQRAAFRRDAENMGKPPEAVERIVQGRLEKYYAETCLLKQPFIRDEGTAVQDLITQAVAKLGENIVVRRFVRLEIEG
ncbi:MAG: translation elongation factor Ts [Anaerolineae bacterium]|nr:translation elongation factor Ts [Anaerolineae bacterium]